MIITKFVTINVQYVSNGDGKITAVQITLKQWKEMERKLAAFDIAKSIKEGLKEVEKIERGEITPKSIEDLLNV